MNEEKYSNKYFYSDNSKINFISDISEACKCIYFGIPKTGCSTIKKTLQSIEIEGKDIPPSQIHDKKSSPLKGIFSHDLSVDVLLLQNIYFKFSFTRNPYTRILSAFLDKFVLNDWEKKRRAPALDLDPNKEIRFIEFLDRISQMNYLDMDIHWAPQTYLLPTNLHHVDFLGTFENFINDWNFILKILSQRSTSKSSNIFVSQNVRWHETNASNLINKYYNHDCINIVKNIYQCDFDSFSYNLNII